MVRYAIRRSLLWSVLLFSALGPLAAPYAEASGAWAFPVGAAESGEGWYVSLALGASWTSTSGVAYRGHLAEDWFKSSGTTLGQPVYAAANGRIVVLRQNCGNYVDVVVIEHEVDGQPIYSLYGHIEADGYVVEGQQVQRRQQLGVIGNPVIFSPHLHFSIFNRTAFERGPLSNCSDVPNGRYVASGYSGKSNDYDSRLDYYDPSNDGIIDNRFYHPRRFIHGRLTGGPFGTNLARNAINWRASSSYTGDFAGNKAYDGVLSPYSKWTSDGASAQSWLALDLGGAYSLTGFVVHHAGAAGEPGYYNTQSYVLQYGSSLSGPWTSVATVTNIGQQNSTSTVLTRAVVARYVRLYVLDAGIDNYARIAEFEVYGGVNVARGAVRYAASSVYNGESTGNKAYDGVLTPYSKWTSNGASAQSWLALDLGNTYGITGFIVRHAGASGEPRFYNTQSFRLQYGSSLSGPWTTITTVNNEAQQNVSTTPLATPVSARYVRLHILDAGIDNHARIPEFEVYGTVNRARTTARWSASSSYNAAYGGNKAYDGIVSPSSKWTSNGASTQSWLALDLGAARALTSFVVRHAGAGGESTYYNTQAYRIEIGSSFFGPWASVATVSNTAQQSVTTTTLAGPVNARYVRLYVIDAGIDNHARIPELEIYALP